MQKLEADFKESGGIFKEWKIGDLFDIHPTASYKMTNPDLFKTKGTTPVVTNSSIGNGITGNVDLKATEKGGIITYSDTTTSDGIFYQPKDFIGYSHVQGLYPFERNVWSEKSLLYIVSLFRKAAAGRFDYANKFTRKIASELILSLPTTTTGKIDFAHMEKYIQLIEDERLDSLKRWLKQNNLADTTLTTEETAALNKFRSGKVKFEEFRIEDVLDWQQQKEIDPLKIQSLTIQNNKKYPFYGQATINNGVISYESLIKDVLNNVEGKPTILIHSNNQNCVYLETPFYLKDGHGATSVLQNTNLSEKTAMYFIGAISKVISRKYSYNEKATKIALKNTVISLPVTAVGKIDYDFMEHFISAQQKIALSGIAKIT